MDKRFNITGHSQIVLLRHGECLGGRIFRGHTDVDLSGAGEAQMQLAMEKLNLPWHGVWSSPLRRCRLFAEAFSQINTLPLTIEENLKEMSFGHWDGVLIEEVWLRHRQEIQQWSEDPTSTTPEGGESIIHLANRIHALLRRWEQECVDQNILIVSHGGLIRVLLCLLLQAPLSSANRWHIAYASVIRLHLLRTEQKSIWQIEMPGVTL